MDFNLIKTELSNKAIVIDGNNEVFIDAITGSVLATVNDMKDFDKKSLNFCAALITEGASITKCNEVYQITMFWFDFIKMKHCVSYAFIKGNKCFTTTTTYND